MTARIISLPTAAPSYIAVRKAGRRYKVDLVTPIETGRKIRTTLASTSSLAAAIRYAEETGLRMKRPVRLPRQAKR